MQHPSAATDTGYPLLLQTTAAGGQPHALHDGAEARGDGRRRRQLGGRLHERCRAHPDRGERRDDPLPLDRAAQQCAPPPLPSASDIRRGNLAGLCLPATPDRLPGPFSLKLSDSGRHTVCRRAQRVPVPEQGGLRRLRLHGRQRNQRRTQPNKHGRLRRANNQLLCVRGEACTKKSGHAQAPVCVLIVQ